MIRIVPYILPYIPLIYILGLIRIVRKIIFLYGTLPALLSGFILVAFFLTVSILLYRGVMIGRMLYLVFADCYCGIMIPLTVLSIVIKGFALEKLLYLIFAILLLFTVYLLTSSNMKELFLSNSHETLPD